MPPKRNAPNAKGPNAAAEKAPAAKAANPQPMDIAPSIPPRQVTKQPSTSGAPFAPASVAQTYALIAPASGGLNHSKLQSLDLSGHLEQLWVHFSVKASREHVFCLILLINERCAHSECFPLLDAASSNWKDFFDRVVELAMPPIAQESHSQAGASPPHLTPLPQLPHGGLSALPPLMHAPYLIFLTNAYRALEVESIRQAVLPYVSLPLLSAVSAERRSRDIAEYSLQKHWEKVLAATAGSSSAVEGGGERREEEIRSESAEVALVALVALSLLAPTTWPYPPLRPPGCLV